MNKQVIGIIGAMSIETEGLGTNGGKYLANTRGSNHNVASF